MSSSKSLMARLWVYQKERFPVFAHGILIAAFTFSAVSYSRLSRGLATFIEWGNFWPGLVVAFTFFLLMRILDEHKDAVNDRNYRKYLPVPRGLVSLSELKVIGIICVLIQLGMILFFHWELRWLYVIMMAYLALMTAEFFIPKWLSEKPIIYMYSHMFIMPLFDMYSSGMDWQLEGNGLHGGIWIFLLVSFFNGTVLEIGRKIRIPPNEERGIKTYSGALGTRKAAVFWLLMLSITFALAWYAAVYADLGNLSVVILVVVFLAMAIPGILFFIRPRAVLEKYIEIASGIWTLGMYLILGGVPMLLKTVLS